ncbi:GcrA family cell cycle regulator [Parvularcula marina]|uniref:GcrA family cell cycle regulator n=1 Tax=Parvularcula marina TaxID=2292771 RepID=UPI003516EDC5
MAWTEERVDQLKQLWGEGLSASQIANKMGGVTRNAVIGKVHRLGLAGRATPAAPKPKTVQRYDEPELKTPITGLENLYPGIDRPTVSSIDGNQCKWPIGDPTSEEFHFCGQPSNHGKPYCAYHSQVAFQPNTGRREPKRITPTALPKIKVAG